MKHFYAALGVLEKLLIYKKKSWITLSHPLATSTSTLQGQIYVDTNKCLLNSCSKTMGIRVSILL